MMPVELETDSYDLQWKLLEGNQTERSLTILDVELCP